MPGLLFIFLFTIINNKEYTYSLSYSIILFNPILDGYRDKLLWDYLQQLLNDPLERYNHVIRWQNRFEGIFKIVDPAVLAQLWGLKKNHPTMTYDKLSRSLRYYYKDKKLRKVPSQRQVYQFLFSEVNPPRMDPKIALIMDELNRKNDVLNLGCNIVPELLVKQELVMVKEEKVDQELNKK